MMQRKRKTLKHLPTPHLSPKSVNEKYNVIKYLPILKKCTNLPLDVLKIICNISFNHIAPEDITVELHGDPICEDGIITQYLNIIFENSLNYNNVNYIVCISRFLSVDLQKYKDYLKPHIYLEKCLFGTFYFPKHKKCYILPDFNRYIVYENGYLSPYCNGISLTRQLRKLEKDIGVKISQEKKIYIKRNMY